MACRDDSLLASNPTSFAVDDLSATSVAMFNTCSNSNHELLHFNEENQDVKKKRLLFLRDPPLHPFPIIHHHEENNMFPDKSLMDVDKNFPISERKHSWVENHNNSCFEAETKLQNLVHAKQDWKNHSVHEANTISSHPVVQEHDLAATNRPMSVTGIDGDTQKHYSKLIEHSQKINLLINSQDIEFQNKSRADEKRTEKENINKERVSQSNKQPVDGVVSNNSSSIARSGSSPDSESDLSLHYSWLSGENSSQNLDNDPQSKCSKCTLKKEAVKYFQYKPKIKPDSHLSVCVCVCVCALCS